LIVPPPAPATAPRPNSSPRTEIPTNSKPFI
jgi:hypothetical protein